MSSGTIAAVATAVAAGEGSVAIVRISGPEAERIGQSLFKAPGDQRWESHRVLYGHVCDPQSGERIDEALLLLMRAPRSFTRETVVELHCHGGLISVQRVLELVLSAGARRALPGEFSQRAFLNGRLDLTRAEAISELVTARSRRAAQLAMAGLDGGLERRISVLRERLLDQLAELEARVDFEDDLPPLDGSAVAAELEQVQQELTESRSYLEKLTGQPCRALAYPYGRSNPAVLAAVTAAGYQAAFSIVCADPAGFDTCYTIPRIYMGMELGKNHNALFKQYVTEYASMPPAAFAERFGDLAADK